MGILLTGAGTTASSGKTIPAKAVVLRSGVVVVGRDTIQIVVR